MILIFQTFVTECNLLLDIPRDAFSWLRKKKNHETYCQVVLATCFVIIPWGLVVFLELWNISLNLFSVIERTVSDSLNQLMTVTIKRGDIRWKIQTCRCCGVNHNSGRKQSVFQAENCLYFVRLTLFLWTVRVISVKRESANGPSQVTAVLIEL